MATFETIAYSEVIDKVTSRPLFNQEGYMNIGKTMYSFKGGKLYRHGGGNTNEFNGVTYKSKIRFVVNENINITKIAKTMAIEGLGKPEKVTFRTEHPYTQETDLVSAEITEKEGVLYASLLNDKLSPNVAGDEYEKMLKGDPLRSTIIEVEIEYPAGAYFELRNFTLGYIPSAGHTV